MSKETVFQFLKKNKSWYTSMEVAEGVGTNQSNASRCLRKLREEGDIKFKLKHTFSNSKYIYKIK